LQKYTETFDGGQKTAKFLDFSAAFGLGHGLRASK